ncbi:MAG TPA: GNAT family N-acetyltransferase [Fimbriimonas sp.]|nr:GNAT family N-acetyltransferase [Fimbriimonas sp.]
MTLPESIEVFVDGFTASKSQTHPYVCDRVDGLWIMHDAPGRKDARKTEIVTCCKEPVEAAKAIKRTGVGWHFLCHLHESQSEFEAIREAYKGLGYKAISTEWMFWHDLRQVPLFETEPPARLVPNQAEADSIPQLGSRKVKLLKGARQFGVWDEKRDYGWARSQDTGGASWISSLYVREDVRRRGYGRALMSTVLQSDREIGLHASVLLASTAGSMLYPVLGFQQLGILQMFCPAKR